MVIANTPFLVIEALKCAYHCTTLQVASRDERIAMKLRHTMPCMTIYFVMARMAAWIIMYVTFAHSTCLITMRMHACMD